MKNLLWSGKLHLALLLSFSFALCAQVRTTGEIQGTVVDPSGSAVPNAVLTLKDLSTAITKTANSANDGGFVFLNLMAGKYELTASAAGFQTAVYKPIEVMTAQTADVAVHLVIGQTRETVEVNDVLETLQTTSNQVATTVQNTFILELPFNGRDGLNFALLSPGAQTIDTGRTSTFNGLPNASLNITLDGMNNNSQRFKSGGTSFFSFAPARLDAIDEVTVTTAGMTADASGEGAMQMRFVTKRGTDRYHWKLYEQFWNDDLNANSFINNARGIPRTKLRQNDFGGNFGGRLLPWVPALKNRLFFFINMEAFPHPSTGVYTQTVLTPSSQSGVFSYVGTDGVQHSANVLTLAAAAGYSGAVNPIVSKILGDINGTLSKGSLTANTDLISNTLSFTQPNSSKQLFPTARVDYQITDKLAWHGTWNLRYQNNDGVANYPGQSILDLAYKITTYVATNSLDWTITPTMFNNFTFGIQSNGEYFNQGTTITQWGPYNNQRINLGWGAPVVPDDTPWVRNNPVFSFSDNLSWVKGKHTFTFGGTWLKTSFWEESWGYAGVPEVYLGISDADPVSSIFNNIPFISSADVSNAGLLYATLAGRISSIYGGLNVDEHSHQYIPYSSLTQRFAFTTGGVFFQDSYRVTPTLTLNYGMRWEFPGTIYNTNGIDASPDMANFWGPSTGPFQVGVKGVTNPVMTLRPNMYTTSRINPAPNFGFAWNPKFDAGPMKTIFGENTVVRGSYGITYYAEGLNSISNVESGNPGSTNVQWLNPGDPGFTPGGLTVSSALPALNSFPTSFTFPMPESLFALSGTWYNTTQPHMRTPYVQNWTFGIQREVAKNTILEARYVGNRSLHMWHYYDLQETNIFENGFLQEFKNAQNNYAINAAAGVSSFANRGLPGQVALPIFQTAFGARGSMPALPSAFTNGTYITYLKQGQAGAMAQSLATTIDYYCRLVGNTFSPCGDNGFDAAGPYAINFFQPNPYAGELVLQNDNGFSNYNGLQVELKKALSKGFTVDVNYTLSKSLSNMFNPNDQTSTAQVHTLRNERLNYGPSPFDLRNVFQAYWTYQLPVGKDRALNIKNRLVDGVFGGWTLSGIHRITSGRIFQLTSGYQTVNGGFGSLVSPASVDSGVVLNGNITASQLQSMLNQTSNGPSKNLLWVSPQLIGTDHRANQQYLAPPTTPGVFGDFVFLRGPGLVSTDLALNKEVRFTERLRFGFQTEAINAFNHSIFGLGAGTYNLSIMSTSFGQTTSTIVAARQLQLRAYLQW